MGAAAGPAPSPNGSGGATADQPLIDQRISQAAVRRANALVARLEAGLAGSDIADGSVTAADLAPPG